MQKENVVIIGAGPAGIAAYYSIMKNKELNPIIIEAGSSINNRIKDLSQTSIINGFGGAGLFSDRKITGFPAGQGLMKTNPYELLDSTVNILNLFKSIVPDQSNEFDNLINKTKEYLSGSSEDIERMYIKDEFIKKSPSVIISNFDNGIKIIKYFESQIKNILYNTIVLDIMVNIKQHDKKYTIKLSNGNIIYTNYIIMSMGRFGYLSMKNFSIFNNKDESFVPRRLEYGLRININNELSKKLEAIIGNDMCYDPKFKFKSVYNNIDYECRTFCVCMPKNGSGYIVTSTDIVSGIVSKSGSSSYDELCNRKDLEYIVKGSNLGIMVRIYNKEFIQKNATQLSNISNFINELVNNALNKMVNKICGNDISDNITYGPCIEGTGYYPNINEISFEMKSHKGIYVAGDMTGIARGLLQSFIMGDIVSKSLQVSNLQYKLIKSKMLYNYQAIDLPAFSYNKTIFKNESYSNYLKLYDLLNTLINKQSLEDIIKSDIFKDRMNDIKNNIHHVRATGYGVLYEIHHFFLDTKIYNNTSRLDYITNNSMIQFILLCNLINKNKDNIINILISNIEFMNINIPMDIKNNILDTFRNNDYKPCILALRTRDNLETRDRYTDIPIMQPAFKIRPVPYDMYKIGSEKSLHELEILIVSMLSALLDIFYKKTIDTLNLGIKLVRTKIETQENSIYPINGEAPYYECHVKVKINKKDTNIDYYTKKRVIQKLASLFEGKGAVETGIFNIISVSINLLKHPKYSQQFFLTFRTDTKKEMEYMRNNFNQIMTNTINKIKHNSPLYELKDYIFTYIPDSEFVIYDNNRDLDIPWFPITSKFLTLEMKDYIRKN